jgi:hypothetical protein
MSTALIEAPAKNIYQKLVEVRKSVGGHLKKENEGAQYNYVSSAQVLMKVRGAMNKQSLLVIPNVKTCLSVDRQVSGKSGIRLERVTTMELEYIVVNAENPKEQIVVPWVAEGIDSGEKGIGKALTYGEKYFYLKLFGIATDSKDDPDAHQETEKHKKLEPRPLVQEVWDSFKNRFGKSAKQKLKEKMIELGVETSSDLTDVQCVNLVQSLIVPEPVVAEERWKEPWMALGLKNYAKEEAESYLRGQYEAIGKLSTKELSNSELDSVIAILEEKPKVSKKKKAKEEAPEEEIEAEQPDSLTPAEDRKAKEETPPTVKQIKEKMVPQTTQAPLAPPTPKALPQNPYAPPDKQNPHIARLWTLEEAMADTEKNKKVTMYSKLAMKNAVDWILPKDEGEQLIKLMFDCKWDLDVFFETAKGLLRKRQQA